MGKAFPEVVNTSVMAYIFLVSMCTAFCQKQYSANSLLGSSQMFTWLKCRGLYLSWWQVGWISDRVWVSSVLLQHSVNHSDLWRWYKRPSHNFRYWMLFSLAHLPQNSNIEKLLLDIKTQVSNNNSNNNKNQQNNSMCGG